MSALDQAFIRAYTRQDVSRTTEPECAPAIPLAEALNQQPSGTLHRLDPPGCGPGDAPAADAEDHPAAIPPPHMETGRRTRSGKAARTPFRPMLQVDEFVWPRICSRLEKAAPESIDPLADRLDAAAEAGRKVIAISACRDGEGATTVLLCAAKRLSERGRSVVLVDASLAQPCIAERLSLQPEFGWEEVLAGKQPLEEAVIESTHRALAVLPLCGTLHAAVANGEQQALLLENLHTLAGHYHLVLVDWGPLQNLEPTGAPPRGIGDGLDAVAVVHNAAVTEADRLDELCRCLAAIGTPQLGIIQNFARD